MNHNMQLGSVQKIGLATAQHELDEYISKLEPSISKVNAKIHDHPELAYQEFIAHDTICDFLGEEGFDVTRNAYNIPTSFEARSGTGGRMVNFNAEYDALPGIGHACGHNLIAAASLVGYIALSHLLKSFGVKGRTQLLGTPAEEDGGGKIDLINKGAFEGVDVSLMIHPCSIHEFSKSRKVGAAGITSIAHEAYTAEFRGRSAHTAANPWDGANALDAIVSSYNSISMLRQQTHPSERIHGCILESPKISNAILEFTKVSFSCRSPTISGVKRLGARVRNCLEGGALATGCQVEIETEAIYADLRINSTLCSLFTSAMEEYGHSVIREYDRPLEASTDQGNVSYEIPSLHAMVGIPCAVGAMPHDRSFAQAAGSQEAFERILDAGKSLALCGWQILTDDESTFQRVLQDFERDKASR